MLNASIEACSCFEWFLACSLVSECPGASARDVDVSSVGPSSHIPGPASRPPFLKISVEDQRMVRSSEWDARPPWNGPSDLIQHSELARNSRRMRNKEGAIALPRFFLLTCVAESTGMACMAASFDRVLQLYCPTEYRTHVARTHVAQHSRE